MLVYKFIPNCDETQDGQDLRVDSNVAEKFGEWVRSRREMLDKTQEVCSGDAGMATSTWSNIENGQISPNMKIQTLLGIFKALEFDPGISLEDVSKTGGPLSDKGTEELIRAAFESTQNAAQEIALAKQYFAEILKRFEVLKHLFD